MKTRIESIKLIREIDSDPDLSYLGEYSNHESANSIDREARGDCGRHEYRYFTPAMTGEETGNPDSPEQDYERAESYNRGGWCMVGVYAVAEVIVNGTVQRIRSGGLYGIESDSDLGYFEDVARDELADLAATLADLGLSARAIKSAMPSRIL